jgi:hypothetical protein
MEDKKAHKHQRPSFDLWASLDDTHAHNGSRVIMAALEKTAERLSVGKDVRIHEYTTGEVVGRYGGLPSLIEQAKKDPALDASWKKRYGDKEISVGYMGMEQVLAMWAAEPDVQARFYKHVVLCPLDSAVLGLAPLGCVLVRCSRSFVGSLFGSRYDGGPRLLQASTSNTPLNAAKYFQHPS